MADQRPDYDQGRYWGRCISQAIGESKAKEGESQGSRFVALGFQVRGKVNAADPEGHLLACPAGERTVFLYLTEKSIERTIDELRSLGFDKDSFKFLLPETPGYVNLNGVECALQCRHETYQGKTKDKWSIAGGGGPNIKALDTAGVRQLDALYGKALKAKPAAKPTNGAKPPPEPATPYSEPAKTLEQATAEAAAIEQGDEIPF